MSVLSFLGNVNIAIRIVDKLYPKAQLYEVDGTTSDGKPTTDPIKINKLRVVFTADEGTVLINSASWGEWNAPTYIPEPWLEDVVIPFPIDMDIVDAQAIKDKAGYTTEYAAVTLRWPLYPGTEEPYYIFSLKNHHVFVGVYTKQVFVENLKAKTKP
ncbi:hypothetical protein CPB83DRAFT_797973 [Crepidotus variabilis]|uniref:Uncharacterized protein n=1 Tax=Crepidotus variabilis TaxID=179855 RepID=A0A9P6E8G8_9AGAR|nr:hypothetical protein CPB83DRAFT_797973 [Crepidotus variabilis]